MSTNKQAPFSWRQFHEDEDGLESLQVIMILAIAAVALITVKNFWPKIRSWFVDKNKEVLDADWKGGQP